MMKIFGGKMTKEEFLNNVEFTQPYNKKDLEDAIELGRQMALEEVRLGMIGMSVNGILQSVLTEEKFNKILKKEVI